MPAAAFDHLTAPIMVEIGGSYTYVHVEIWEPESPETAVLLIHDLAGRAEDFAPLCEHLAKAGHRVIAIDLPGRGNSAWLPQELYTAQTYVQVLLAALKTHGLTQTAVLGQGWGALIAVLLERVAHRRFTRMYLLDLPKSWSFAADQSAQTWARLVQIQSPDQQMFQNDVDATIPDSLAGRADLLSLAVARARLIDGRFKLNVDPAIFGHLSENSDKTYDIDAALTHARAPIWLFSSMSANLPDISDAKHPALIRRIWVLRASNLSWHDETLLAPVLGAFCLS